MDFEKILDGVEIDEVLKASLMGKLADLKAEYDKQIAEFTETDKKLTEANEKLTKDRQDLLETNARISQYVMQPKSLDNDEPEVQVQTEQEFYDTLSY